MRERGRRIMMTTDAVGGVWSYATMLAQELVVRGDQVTLVTLGPAPTEQQRQDVDARSGALELLETDLMLEWLDPAGDDRVRAAATLLDIANELRPDVIHLNSYREGAISWPAPALVVAHSCVASWWQACYGSTPHATEWTAYRRSVQAGLQAADAWVTPTAAFRNTMRSLYHPSAPGAVIHNGIDFLTISSRPKRDVVLASGRLWDSAKNLQCLSAIAPSLRWPIEIAGPAIGSNGERIAQVDNVRHLGALPRERLRERMASAAIYVAPARYEPFGLGVLEAAAAGCALVLSDCPTFRELWDGAATFVEIDDADSLGAKINELAGDFTLRARLQREAARRARCYSISRTAQQYIAIYDMLQCGACPPVSNREASA